MAGEGSESPDRIPLKDHFKIGSIVRRVFKPREEGPPPESPIDQAVQNNQIEPARIGFLRSVLNKLRLRK